MKRKFLITNDVGIAQDKVKYLFDTMTECGGELYGKEYEETLIEVLSHLQQALDNLAFEEDFDDV